MMISANRLAAVFFDLDGTIVLTDELHLEAYNEALEPYGVVIDEPYYRLSIMGRENRAIMQDLLPEADEAGWDMVAAAKESAFRREVGELRPAAGFLELLSWLEARRLQVTVVTNAPRENAELMLGALGLRERLHSLVIGEELARGKPDPLPYLTGLSLAGVTADQGIAFEDSLSGVRSACAAGLHTFGMTTALSPEALTAAGARGTICDFKAPQLWDFLEHQA